MSKLLQSLHVLFLMICAVLGDDSLSFMVLGDWGGQGFYPWYTLGERNVADAMGKKAAELHSSFTVSLGDNFYTKGVTNADDHRFQDTFESVFVADSLQSRWYVVAGNHDHYGNVSAEVEYTKRSHRWYMPRLYYTEVLPIAGTQATAQLVFIDTIVLAGLSHPTIPSVPPAGPSCVSEAEDQWAWIEETLAASNATWLLVFGHYPVWSIAEHGPTQVLVDRLRPMLIKYNVDAYFCGHDHDVQHIHEQNSSVEYFVSGAGHDTNPSEAHMSSIPANSLLFSYGLLDLLHSRGAFNSVQLTAAAMDVTYFDAEGNQLYSYSRNNTK